MSKAIDLKDKVVWLIGASQGIGRELAKGIAGESPKALVLSSRGEEGLKSLVAEIGGGASYKVLDVGDEGQVRSIGEEIKGEFGSVDVLIVNSGIYEITYPDKFSASEYEHITRVNYFGALYATESVIGNMLSRSSGVIVVVSSIAGVRPIPGGGAYGASKAALTYFFEALRMQVQDRGVKIILVHPGFVSTRLTAKNEFKMPGLLTAEDAGTRILEGIKAGKDEISFPFWFVSLIRLLRFLPESLYRKLVMKLDSPKES